MKHLGLLALLAILFVLSGSVKAAGNGFIKTRGIHFMINGYIFYANGFNAYWLMYVASDPSQRYKVSDAFRGASSHGLTVARTWAFSDGGYRALQYAPGSYNEDVFKGLDFVIAEARKYGLKLILSLANNYESFGGKKQYVDWARGQGQYLTSDDDFFRNSLVKGFYKNHVKTVLNRRNTFTGVVYKNDPTIMAWELMNEPRCTSDPSGKTIQSWIMEMAYYVKSLDSNHLLEAGLEGMSSSDDQAQLAFLTNWLNAHIQDSQYIIKKPLLIAEFGKSWKDPGFNPNQRDALYRTVYYTIYSSAKRGGAAAGGLFWQLLTDGMDNFRDGYEILLSQSTSTANLISQQCHKLSQIRRIFARMKNLGRLRRAKATGKNHRMGRNRGKQIGN
nr:mannan endo-1,4-beta-mannosidase 7-like [Ipomoea trifida]